MSFYPPYTTHDPPPCRFLCPRAQEWGGDLLFDASNRDGPDEEGAINLQSWPTVKGMYMPDAITTFKGIADGKRCKFFSSWRRRAHSISGAICFFFASQIVYAGAFPPTRVRL